MAARLSLFFAGTRMTWEDMAFFLELGGRERHNLYSNAAHYYYFFDGPAASVSDQHPAVETLRFDKSQRDFIQSKPRTLMNPLGELFRFSVGAGLYPIAKTAYDLLCYLILEKGIREIDLIGFSRGGSIALSVGVLLDQLKTDLSNQLTQAELNAIQVHITAIDPVAGKANNRAAKRFGKISHFVKTCLIGLATNESLPGFHPRDVLSNVSRYNIEFDDQTQYAFLPFPDDHVMCLKWMKDLVQCQLPNDTELLSSCSKTNLIKRRLGMNGVNWIDTVDETSAYRMIHDVKYAAKYKRSILPLAEDQSIHIKKGIEVFFKYMSAQHAVYNIDHISLQNDADCEKAHRFFESLKIGGRRVLTKTAQSFFARKARHPMMKVFGCEDRACKIKIADYTNLLFVNLLHEAMFSQRFPYIHRYLCDHQEKDVDNAIAEMFTISNEDYPFTRSYVETALIQHIQLKPIESFKSTNIKDLDTLFQFCAKYKGSLDGALAPSRAFPIK